MPLGPRHPTWALAGHAPKTALRWTTVMRLVSQGEQLACGEKDLNPDPEAVLHMVLLQMQQLVDLLYRHRLHELMAVRHPPQGLQEVLALVMDIIKESPCLKGVTRLRNQEEWEYLRKIASGMAEKFRAALAGWPWAALRGEVSERQMSLAQKRAVDLAWLGRNLTPLGTSSDLKMILGEWARLAMKLYHFYRLWTNSGQHEEQMELDDFLELKALQGEEDSCETQVSLLVDLAPVWHVLETKSYEDERLEALKALRILGGTSPVRTIRTAGPVLFEEEELASLAQEAIAATGCEPQEELQVEFLAVLTQQLRLYETTSPRLVTRRLRPASEVLALLFPKGAVGHGEAFEWLAFVLAEGSQPEQSSALSAFTALIEGEESWSPCVEVLVQRLLQPSLRRDQESQLNEALAIVCRRAPDAVRDVLLTRLTCDDSSPAALARLARSVTFVGTNEELTKALVKHLESMHGTYLVELARGLQEVSSDCKPQVFEALRHELQRRQPPCDHGCEDVVRVIGSCWPVDGVLRELSGYLAQASRRVATEGAGPVAAVLDAASSMASSAAQPLLVRSQMVLARRLRDTGDVVALEALRRSFAAAADEPRGAEGCAWRVW
ncbi:DNA repair helicase UVH6 [Durusdinium trenchii]|uniref:DNA repair helicase UVH6 n=1 Tax=Durusdinium trenchii TaxID=1381693 RepID=A0ABP0L3L4_9DINO